MEQNRKPCASPSKDISDLKAKGIYAVSVFSVESIYYHPEIQRRVVERHAGVTGEDANERLDRAKAAAIAAILQHVQRMSADFGGRIEIRTTKDNAGVGRRRPECHQDLLAGVHAHTLGADGVFESALSEHVSPIPRSRVLLRSRVAPLPRRRRKRASGSDVPRHVGVDARVTPLPPKGALP